MGWRMPADIFRGGHIKNDSLMGGGPTADWLAVLSPAGHGWGLDFGAVLSLSDTNEYMPKLSIDPDKL